MLFRSTVSGDELFPEGIDSINGNSNCTAVADIGTTTIAVLFYKNETGRIVSGQLRDNPQKRFGADVLSRLLAAVEGNSESLREDIVNCLLNMAEEAGCGDRVTEWIITGNTSMLTLLAGEDPTPLMHAPYHARRLFDEVITLGGASAYLAPCFQAFIGADALCSLLASGLTDTDEPGLICDIGTNGEMILWNEGKGYAASVPAGPALEGVGIRRGCRAVPGSIDRVTLTGSGILAHTIKDPQYAATGATANQNTIENAIPIGKIPATFLTSQT